jgi:uncharacterized membrane protein
MGNDSKLVALVFQETSEFTVQPGFFVGGGGQVAAADAQPNNAEAALKEIEKRAKEAGVELKDAVIAFKASDGRIKIRQAKDLTVGKGAGRGGLLGLLVGLVLGGPLVGALLGLGIGAIVGRRVDHGLDDEFIKRLGKSLKPKDSVLLLLIDQELSPEGKAYLESFNAELHITDFSAEAEEAMSKAAEDEAIARALKAEFAEE